jgi:hypothetical protein
MKEIARHVPGPLVALVGPLMPSRRISVQVAVKTHFDQLAMGAAARKRPALLRLSRGERDIVRPHERSRDRQIAKHLDYLSLDSLIFQKAFLLSQRPKNGSIADTNCDPDSVRGMRRAVKKNEN